MRVSQDGSVGNQAKLKTLRFLKHEDIDMAMGTKDQGYLDPAGQ